MPRDYFQSKEFRNILTAYEQRKDKEKSVYLDADDFADIADYYLTVDKFDKAIEALDMGLSIHPNDDSILVVQSAAYILQRMYKEAEEVLSLLDPENSDVKYQIAQIQYARYRNDIKAEKLWREWMEMDNRLTPSEEHQRENYIHIITSMAELRGVNSTTGTKDWNVDLTRRWIREYIDKFSPLGKFESDIHLADICREHELADLMCEVLTQVLEEQPYLKKGWSNLALAYYMLERYDQAIEACDFALAVEPGDMDTILTKAHALNSMGEKLASKPVFKEYLERGGDPVQSIPYAEALFLEGQEKEAVQILLGLQALFDAKRQEEKNSYANSDLDLLGSSTRPDDFLELCERVYTDIGDMFYHHAYYKESVQAFKSILEENKEYAEAYFMIGVNLLALETYDEASRNFAHALMYAKDQVMMGLDIALTFVLNDFDEFALEVLNAVSKIATQSQSPFARNLSAAKSVAYLKTGEKELFLLNFKIACQECPDLVQKVYHGYFPASMPVSQWYDYAEGEIDVLSKKFKKENLYIKGFS